MAVTQIHGERQVLNDTIKNAQINSAAAIATSKLADAANFILRGGSVAFTANQSMGGFRLTNVGDAVGEGDAVNLGQLHSVAAGVSFKQSVRVATTANITLSGAQSIDGVSVTAGDRVLVKNQTAGAENGIYNVDEGGAWVRSDDFSASDEVKAGLAVWVNEGTANGDTGWVLTTNDAITLGTTALVFTQFSGLGQVTAGSGLTKTGNTLNVGQGAGITVNADNVMVKLNDPSGLGFNTGMDDELMIICDPGGWMSIGDDGLAVTGVNRQWKRPVRGATTANITLSGAQTIDGVSIVAADRVLVKNQTTASQNGIYDCATGAWTRATDWDANDDVLSGAAVIVQEGTTNGNKLFVLTTDGSILPGTTSIAFAEISGGASINFADNETPSGTINGSNQTFTLANTPTAGSVKVYLNGILQDAGAGNDYTISGSTITYLTAPISGDKIRANYRY